MTHKIRTRCYRPVGLKELQLIRAAAFRASHPVLIGSRYFIRC